MSKPSNLCRAVRELNFDCGCFCFQSILRPSEPWDVIPCFAHAGERARITRLAEETWAETEAKLNSQENLGK